MAQRIVIRRDDAAVWESVNPVLADGEIGLEKDTLRFKVGDGVSAWLDLNYYNETDLSSYATTAYVDDSINAIPEPDLSAYATTASPALTGNPTAPTQAVGNNSTRLATTAFVATGYQPLDSDLTAIAALTTTATGRGLLTESVTPTGTGALVRAANAVLSGNITGASSISTNSLDTANLLTGGVSVASLVNNVGIPRLRATIAASYNTNAGNSIWLTDAADSTTRIGLNRNDDSTVIIAHSGSLGWAANSGDVRLQSVGLGFDRASADAVEINNGTVGTLRDMSLRNLTASGSGNFGGSGVASPTLSGGVGVYSRQSGSSSSFWRGRIVAGGDVVAFLMGEYNSQAWLGGHNAALNAWAPLRINPDGTADLFLGNQFGAPGAAPILTLVNSNGTASFRNSVAIGAGTPISQVVSATATLDFASLAANSFQDLTVTVTGAASGDAVIVNPVAGSAIGDVVYTSWVSSANTVTVRASNVSATTARDPASGTFRATVIKF